MSFLSDLFRTDFKNFFCFDYLVSFPGPPRGFRGPGTKLQSEAPCVCDRSEQKGQKTWESTGPESGGALRAL